MSRQCRNLTSAVPPTSKFKIFGLSVRWATNGCRYGRYVSDAGGGRPLQRGQRGACNGEFPSATHCKAHRLRCSAKRIGPIAGAGQKSKVSARRTRQSRDKKDPSSGGGKLGPKNSSRQTRKPAAEELPSFFLTSTGTERHARVDGSYANIEPSIPPRHDRIPPRHDRNERLPRGISRDE